jgi:hypothetical protein
MFMISKIQLLQEGTIYKPNSNTPLHSSYCTTHQELNLRNPKILFNL